MKLLKTYQVKNLLQYLELTRESFVGLSIRVTPDSLAQKVWELGRKLGVPYLLPEHFFVAELSLVPGIENEQKI